MRLSLFSCLLLLLFKTSTEAAPPITAVAYAPDGKTLVASVDADLLVIDPTTGAIRDRLDAFPGRVTALTFSPDGKTLAVACGEVGRSGELRLHPVNANGTITPEARLSITAHDDAIHAIDFDPTSRILASTGYDTLIHLWNADTGKAIRSLNDHSDAVNALAFSPDGKLLASASADRAVKVWDVASGKRLYTLSDPTDWLYSLAWHPDGKHLTAGGIDKSVRIWKVSRDGGELLRSAFAHSGAVQHLHYSPDGKTLYSVGDDRVLKIWDAASLKEQTVLPARSDTVHDIALSPDGKQLALAIHDGSCLLIDPTSGKDIARPLPTRFPVQAEQGKAGAPRFGRLVELPATLVGTIDRAGDTDFFRFQARAGQELGFAITTRGQLASVVEITDPEGNVLAETETNTLGVICPTAGEYTIQIRDRDYRGDPTMTYHIDAGSIPVVTGVYPLGAQAGTEQTYQLMGVNLGKSRNVTFRIPAPEGGAGGAAARSRHALPLPKSIAGEKVVGQAWIYAGAAPVENRSPNSTGKPLSEPVTVNGSITTPGETHPWPFRAQAGVPLMIEVEADRLGSKLDPFIEILTEDGQPLERATLRCTARTFTVFRDADSKRDGIRIEAWNELSMDDLMYLNGELMKIVALPKNPDDDCRFYHVNGQRQAYLGTTPRYHSLGSPMYKVEVHPPGSEFPPNGMPVFRLPWRNDDGGPGFGKDAMLIFEAPADGNYQVRVGDSRGDGGAGYAYRLTVRRPQPDFNVSFTPNTPKVWRGNGLPITVKVERLDGYDGPITVELVDLPEGFESAASVVEAGHTTTTLTLFATDDAMVPEKGSKPVRLVARGKINGHEYVQEKTGGVPSVVDPGDLITSTDVSEVRIRPGETARLLVQIERRNKFEGRVPLDLKGLPHGVRVLDIGLNGILVLPGQTERRVTIYAEPWVEPMKRPIVVLSRREGKNTEHAAAPVWLKIEE